ncbi:hypothetical protein NR798_24830 [Archangium gephyra]|uniref:hypothetical protein n=1 Tax=Archangium gephyra TaxID=48 RepID=UPI0035D4EDB0
MRTSVTFRTERFNTTEVRPHFLNPGCFGEDCAAWLAEALRAAGAGEVAGPWQEDWGWQLRVTTPRASALVSVGLIPEAAPEWHIMVDERQPLLARLLGGRPESMLPALVRAVDGALRSAADVHGVRWHLRSEFDRGRSEGTPGPFD